MSNPTPEIDGFCPIVGPFFIDIPSELASLEQAEALFKAKGTRFKRVTKPKLPGTRGHTEVMLWREKKGMIFGETTVNAGKKKFEPGPVVLIGKKIKQPKNPTTPCHN